ncbi:MAG: hypothetical protein QM650_10600 [Microlunatus sp.]
MSNTNSSKPDGFWSRQTPKDKVALVAVLFQIILSTVLVVIGLNLDADLSSVPGRFALLSANIVALVASLQFTISRFFDAQSEEVKGLSKEVSDVKAQLTHSISEMESITNFGETYGKISRQAEDVRNQYQSTLDNFLRRLSNCIDDKRSGALDIMDYYGALSELATAIEDDKSSTEKASGTYAGEIWALSFVLDDEWDDSSLQERRWFDRLAELDAQGITTRRLWAFDKKMVAALAKEPLEDDGRELIRRLSLYCSDNTRFPHTTSVALPKEEIVDDHVRLFGKGFFAGAFTAGHLRLIRGVCFDNLLSSNSLGGEIDFDDIRISQIRVQWLRYLSLGKPLKSYLMEIGSPSAKQYMQSSWS